MTILLHDGRRVGHATWLKETITAGLADGAILNPFATPPATIPRNPSAATVIADLGGGQLPGSTELEILFDSASWAATLPGTDFWQVYDEWDLWPHHTRGDLRDAGAIADHVRAVFKIQSELDVPYWRRRWPSILRQGRRLRRRSNSLLRPSDSSLAA